MSGSNEIAPSVLPEPGLSGLPNDVIISRFLEVEREADGGTYCDPDGTLTALLEGISPEGDRSRFTEHTALRVELIRRAVGNLGLQPEQLFGVQE